MEPKERVVQWTMPSESDPRKEYTVTLYSDGTWKCSCPHWIFRLQKTGEDCKHIRSCRGSEFEQAFILGENNAN